MHVQLVAVRAQAHHTSLRAVISPKFSVRIIQNYFGRVLVRLSEDRFLLQQVPEHISGSVRFQPPSFSYASGLFRPSASNGVIESTVNDADTTVGSFQRAFGIEHTTALHVVKTITSRCRVKTQIGFPEMVCRNQQFSFDLGM